MNLSHPSETLDARDSSAPRWAWIVASGLLVAAGCFGWAGVQARGEAAQYRAQTVTHAVQDGQQDAKLAEINTRIAALATTRSDLVANVTRLADEVVESRPALLEDRAEAALIAADKQAAFDAAAVAKTPAKKTTKTPAKKTTTKSTKAPSPQAPESAPTPPPPGRTDRIDLPASRDPLAGL